MLINLADYYSNQGESEKSVHLLDNLKEEDKQSPLAKMLRLKLKINLTDNASTELKDEFEELTKEMINVIGDHSLSESGDEDLVWLHENESTSN